MKFSLCSSCFLGVRCPTPPRPPSPGARRRRSAPPKPNKPTVLQGFQVAGGSSEKHNHGGQSQSVGTQQKQAARIKSPSDNGQDSLYSVHWESLLQNVVHESNSGQQLSRTERMNFLLSLLTTRSEQSF